MERYIGMDVHAASCTLGTRWERSLPHPRRLLQRSSHPSNTRPGRDSDPIRSAPYGQAVVPGVVPEGPGGCRSSP
jgi:hypothetical protein